MKTGLFAGCALSLFFYYLRRSSVTFWLFCGPL